MGRNGELLTNARAIKKILISLNPRFDYVVVAIEEFKEMEKLIVDKLIGSLQASEHKIMKRNGDKAKEHVFNQNYLSKKTNMIKEDFNKWIYHSKKRST
jgi:hypothetical protein